MSRNKNSLPVAIVSIALIGGLVLYRYEQAQHEVKPPTKQSMPRHNRPKPSPSPTPTSLQLPNAECIMRGLLPDPVCTPGVINPNVTQKNIYQTICRSLYTDGIRPSSYYTNKLKHKQMAEYGFADSITHYKEDHLISLELGGSPDDPLNLWPEVNASSKAKDLIEGKLNAAVCSGSIALREAQVRIATNWTTAANGLILNSKTS